MYNTRCYGGDVPFFLPDGQFRQPEGQAGCAGDVELNLDAVYKRVFMLLCTYMKSYGPTYGSDLRLRQIEWEANIDEARASIDMGVQVQFIGKESCGYVTEDNSQRKEIPSGLADGNRYCRIAAELDDWKNILSRMFYHNRRCNGGPQPI